MPSDPPVEPNDAELEEAVEERTPTKGEVLQAAKDVHAAIRAQEENNSRGAARRRYAMEHLGRAFVLRPALLVAYVLAPAALVAVVNLIFVLTGVIR